MALFMEIEKSFGAFHLKVKLEAKNEILALLGASGCGKSVTLKCIAGIEKPDSGIIILDGRVLFDSERKINLSPQKRRTGYLFQHYALFPNMTVEENIAAGIRLPKRKRGKRVSEKIKSFYLEGLENRYPSQLSGGQQQRVAIARILASEPEILMLDEPFSALDSYLKWQLEQEMTDILEKFGGTTLFVSHNRDEVYRICGNLAVMSEGKVDVTGDKWEIFQNPQTRAATLLTGCKNISAVRKVGEYAVFAEDWNILLQTRQAVPEEVRYAGIRAHYFRPAENAEGINRFPYAVDRVIEDTFSNIVMLRFPGSGAEKPAVRWEVDKRQIENFRVDGGAHFLEIDPKDILLMTK